MDALAHLPHAHLLALAATLFGGAVILVWRVKETKSPVTARKILLPPLGMATGFGMFFSQKMRVPWSWGLSAFAAGALLLAIPLERTSKLSVVDGRIFLQRSRAFLAILVGLVAVRLALKGYIEDVLGVSLLQSGAIFYLLAFGMIVRWRAGMFLAFRRLTRQVTGGAKRLGRAA